MIMENIEQLPIGQLVAKDYRTSTVFEKYGIDFCCHGNMSIGQACKQAGADVSIVKKEIRQVLSSPDAMDGGAADYLSWPLDLLADYIEKKHHRYVTSQIPLLERYLEKIAKVHGNQHPELHEIRSLFSEGAAGLSAHMKKEELMLFPLIRKMEQTRQAGKQADGKKILATFGAIEHPIQKMMREHDTEGERFRKIRQLSSNYDTPVDGCTSYRLTYSFLQAFEADLHLHIHLENNILFPKAIEREKELLPITDH